MGKYTEMLFDGQQGAQQQARPQSSQPQKQPEQQGSTQATPRGQKYINMVFEGIDARLSRQDEDVERIPYGEDYDISFRARSKAGFVDDPRGKREIITEDLLPDVPAGEREKLIFKHRDQTVVYDPKDQKYHKVPKETIESIGGSLVGQSPTIVGDVGGAVGGMALGGFPGAVAGSTIGGGAGEYVRQQIGKQFLDDPIDYGRVGREALYAGGGELLFGGLPIWFKQRNLARDIAKMDTKSARALEKKAKDWGITLTPGETTNLGSLIQKQKLLAKRADEAGDILTRFGEERSTDLYNAVNDFMDLVSAEDSVLKGNIRAADAVKKYIDNLDATRRQATKPLYEQARKEGAEVDVSNIVNKIDEQVPTLAGREKGKLNRIKKEFFTDDGSLKTDIESLDNVKKTIDDDIETARRQGRRYQAQLLQDIKSDLVAKMDEASPAYQSARSEFAERSKDINATQGTILEQINKVKEEKIDRIGDMILNSRKSSPRAVAKIKEAVTSQDPGAWNDIARGYMQDLIEQKLKDPEQGNIANIIRKQLWGSEKQKKIWKEALDDQTYRKMSDLMDVFEAASRASKGESWTAMAQAAERDIRKEAGSMVRDPGSNVLLNLTKWSVNPFGASMRMARAIEDVQMDRYTKKIAKALTDPRGMDKLKELKKMDPKSRQFWAGMGALMAEITHGSIAEATGGELPFKEGFDYIDYIKKNYNPKSPAKSKKQKGQQ